MIGVSIKNFKAFFLLFGVLLRLVRSEGLITIILPKWFGSILHAIKVKEEDSPVEIISDFAPIIFLIKSVINCTYR